MPPAHRATLFTDKAYLDALETTGCADADNGWTAAHLQIGAARLPCYEKAHSWGEFVFDFELARIWQSRGRAYYPKLVACVPFTPVPGTRLLADTDGERLQLARTLREQAAGMSSAHILFLREEERALLVADGWIPRAQLRYVWHRRDAADFDGYLGQLDSKRRKNIRAERRKLDGFSIEWRDGASLSTTEWQRIYALYASTYAMRGQQPYLTPDCLQQWSRAFGTRLQFCLAHHRQKITAMAFFFEDGDTLYGRHWGADGSYDGLHFELCYYQGVERCLQRGLAHFDAGVQGEHKRSRGFTTELAHSVHWFNDPGLAPAIADAFAREADALAHYLEPSTDDAASQDGASP